MQPIEQALKEAQSLHEQLTQAPAPDIGPQSFVPFPPGVDPLAFAIEEVSQLKKMLHGGSGTGTEGPTPQVQWVPRASIFAGETSVRYVVEVPGVSKEQVNVAVAGGELVVKGQRSAPPMDPAVKPVLVEQPSGAFERRLPVPPWCSAEMISASCSQGVLEINMTRRGEGVSGEFQVKVG